jgi:hypothetical protein
MDTEDYSPLVSNLQRLAQEWEQLLFSTGGALNLDKCFWFLLAWRWHQGRAKLHTTKTSKHDLHMTSELGIVATERKQIEPSSSYRTLGVHITPSGDSKGALKVLMEAALTYCSNIVASKLTRQETLTSYIQYLFPKLRYQPPLLQLTKRKCDKLMTPVLQAILPKMHINQNTLRAIIHGPEELGGLALPHLHAIQGIDKIKLFVGHLRLNDRSAKLIHIDLTYIQIITGIGEFFSNKDCTPYSWVEKGWLTSLWEFASQVKLTFSYPSAWQPPLPRQGDISLTDFFLSLKLSPKEMELLNQCRLYLQVLTLSDIVAANGLFILQHAKDGVKDNTRESRLRWPNQGKPTANDWTTWRSTLSALESYGRLKSPLGR